MKIFNRRARLDYQLLEMVETGIVLLGWEVKSLIAGRANLEEAFVRIKNGEAYLYNAHIQPYQFATGSEVDPRRTRKLLLKKSEILSLETKMKQRKLTIVPVSCYTTSSRRGVQGSGQRPGSYTRGRLVKLEIALAKGKRAYEHREEIKRRDIQRDAEQELSYGDD